MLHETALILDVAKKPVTYLTDKSLDLLRG